MKFTTEETTTNKSGGKQSKVLARMDLVPALAVYCIGTILKAGSDKYGDNNWRLIPIPEHINHAIIHLYAYLAGDTSEHHLGNAACRLLFALELSLQARSK
ncbi:MAG: dATP/dGTP diphosphohydrolase domain-containing protein [Nostoc sp.]|uniref:dATP/dGTP diphosphohydrolase domain-containing protein n=1 Tax=Nostoc sp. TaxID=1180 RepID=UPI002FF23B17